MYGPICHLRIDILGHTSIRVSQFLVVAFKPTFISHEFDQWHYKCDHKHRGQAQVLRDTRQPGIEGQNSGLSVQ